MHRSLLFVAAVLGLFIGGCRASGESPEQRALRACQAEVAELRRTLAVSEREQARLQLLAASLSEGYPFEDEPKRHYPAEELWPETRYAAAVEAHRALLADTSDVTLARDLCRALSKLAIYIPRDDVAARLALLDEELAIVQRVIADPLTLEDGLWLFDIQHRRCSERVNNAQPEELESILVEYVSAGHHIVETFGLKVGDEDERVIRLLTRVQAGETALKSVRAHSPGP